MRAIRWLEMTSGLAGIVVGLFQLRHIVCDPIYSTASSNGEQQRVSLVQSGDVPPVTVISLSLVAALLLLAAMSATVHSQSGHVFWQRTLWIAAVLLIVYSVLALDAMGYLLLLSAGLMLLAALFSMGNHRLAAQ